MKIVVVGSGGREHALVEAFKREGNEVVITPGRPDCIPGSIDTSVHDIEADLYVVGPEAPLVDGEADKLRAKGKLVFGPNKDGAQVEGSKAYMKQLLADAKVPTADFGVFTDVKPANEFLKKLNGKAAIKTSGLAGGKGVFVSQNIDEGLADIKDKLSGKSFGEAGQEIVVEEFLDGREFSVFAITDGKKVVALPVAQDYKRLENGAMTGGVGSYSPVNHIDDKTLDRVVKTCIQPTLDELRKRGIGYRGVLYMGGMLGRDGSTKVLEYNIRFGDPEAQVVLPRVDNLTDLLYEAASGELKSQPQINNKALALVVLCAEGYPDNPVKNVEIKGLDTAANTDGVTILHAGTKSDGGSILVDGGRTINVVAEGKSIEQARKRAYDAVNKISWPGMQYRSDIAKDI
ncbi:phosphoribosylamine--glycine ligase [Candidatus Saccharibacteria bacterium]|nr:phosphoribosylamine--glycine ligase [Candidatus Saccharibacteria bacterium]